MAANQVSGPGPQAKRTDIGDVQKTQDLPNADYGEQQAFQAQQQGAPMAADQGGMMSQAHAQNLATIVPMNAPTQRPNEPVTAGAASGPGPGPEALGITPPQQNDIAKLQSYLPMLNYMANQEGASWALRNIVRIIKGGGVAGGQ